MSQNFYKLFLDYARPSDSNSPFPSTAHWSAYKAITRPPYDYGIDHYDEETVRFFSALPDVKAHNLVTAGGYVLNDQITIDYSVGVIDTLPKLLHCSGIFLNLVPMVPGAIDIPSNYDFSLWAKCVVDCDFSPFQGRLTIGQYLVLASSVAATRDTIPTSLTYAHMIQMYGPQFYVAMGGHMTTRPKGAVADTVIVAPMPIAHFSSFVALYLKCCLMFGIHVSVAYEEIRRYCYAMWLTFGEFYTMHENGYSVSIGDLDFLAYMAPYITFSSTTNRPAMAVDHKSIVACITMKLLDKFSDMVKEVNYYGAPFTAIYTPANSWDTLTSSNPPIVVARSACCESDPNTPMFNTPIEFPHDTIIEDYKLTHMLVYNLLVSKNKKEEALPSFARSVEDYLNLKKKVAENDLPDQVDFVNVMLDGMQAVSPANRFEAWRKFNVVASVDTATYEHYINAMNLGSQGTHLKLFIVLHAVRLLKGLGKYAIDLCAGEGGFTRLLNKLGYGVAFMDSDGKLSSSNLNAQPNTLFPSRRLPLTLAGVPDYIEALGYLGPPPHLVVSDGYAPPPASWRGPSTTEYSATKLWDNTVEFFLVQAMVANHYVKVGGTIVIKMCGTPTGDKYSHHLDTLFTKYERFYLIKASVASPASFEFYAVFHKKREAPTKFHAGYGMATIWMLTCAFAFQRRRILNAMIPLFVSKISRGDIVKPAEADKWVAPPKSKAGIDWEKIMEHIIETTGPPPGAIALTKCANPVLEEEDKVEVGEVDSMLGLINMTNSKSFLAHVCQTRGLDQPIYGGWVGVDPDKKCTVSVKWFLDDYTTVESAAAHHRKVNAQSDAAYNFIKQNYGPNKLIDDATIRTFVRYQ